MKLVVEEISATRNNAEGFKNIKIRREVLASEKGNASSRRLSILGSSLFEKKGRVAFFVMSDKDITAYEVVVGQDLSTNAKLQAQYGELAIQVIETTDPSSWDEDIRLSMSEKINPTTEDTCLHNGEEIYHTTLLTQMKYFELDGGDITLSIDKA